MPACEAYTDSTLLSGCWQAEAASHAAKLALQGAHWGAIATLVAGLLALAAGAFVLAAARWQAGYSRLEMRANMAAAFIGDVSAWHAHLQAEDVVKTLNAKADAGDTMYFHPGNAWLKVYFHDPGKSGLFSTDIAEELAYYYSRMHGEMGRLIWLHDLAKEGKQAQAWIPREQRNCANSIAALRDRGTKLIKRLEAERDESLEARQHPFRLAFKPR